jgi:Protein of unknown function (DUF4232)
MRSAWILPGSLVIALSLASCANADDLGQKAAPTTTNASAPTGACATDQIHVKYGKGLAGEGDEGAVILFTNVSPTACTMSGYPVVVAENSANLQIPLKETISGPLGGLPLGGAKIPVLRLSQDATASASIEAVAHPSSGSGTCPRYVTLLVGLPGGSPVYQLTAKLPSLGLNLSACNPPPQVHPLLAGINGD